jgi:hypothetical protein
MARSRIAKTPLPLRHPRESGIQRLRSCFKEARRKAGYCFPGPANVQPRRPAARWQPRARLGPGISCKRMDCRNARPAICAVDRQLDPGRQKKKRQQAGVSPRFARLEPPLILGVRPRLRLLSAGACAALRFPGWPTSLWSRESPNLRVGRGRRGASLQPRRREET